MTNTSELRMKKIIKKFFLIPTLFVIYCSACTGGGKADYELDRSSSITGPDVNANGIRDDIDRHIASTYADAKERAAASQAARSMQKTITVDAHDPAAARAVMVEQDRAINCATHVMASRARAYQMLDEIEAITTNTEARLLAYIAYDKALAGTVSSLPSGDTCDDR